MFDFQKIYVLPFKFNIPNYIDVFLTSNNYLKSRIKYIKRYLYIVLKHQKSFEIANILPSHKKIFWINLSATSLGDSLMDLSSRVLLKGRRIDLFTDQKNAALYANDSVFSKVFSHVEEFDECDYDLVIVDSFSARSIFIKNKLAPLTDYVGMFGYFNGPEVNRVLFSFHQMNNMLGYEKKEEEINKLAKCSMSISSKDQEVIQNIKLPTKYITIAIGGEWDYRSYKKWDKVVDKLFKDDNSLNIVLVGSANAMDIASIITNKYSDRNIYDCVSKFTFNQTSEIIKKSQILICCDGGLMHAANSVNTPNIALFARLTPQMQLTEKITCFSIYDRNDVNNIEVSDVLQKYTAIVHFLNSHLQA